MVSLYVLVKGRHPLPPPPQAPGTLAWPRLSPGFLSAPSPLKPARHTSEASLATRSLTVSVPRAQLQREVNATAQMSPHILCEAKLRHEVMSSARTALWAPLLPTPRGPARRSRPALTTSWALGPAGEARGPNLGSLGQTKATPTADSLLSSPTLATRPGILRSVSSPPAGPGHDSGTPGTAGSAPGRAGQLLEPGTQPETATGGDSACVPRPLWSSGWHHKPAASASQPPGPCPAAPRPPQTDHKFSAQQPGCHSCLHSQAVSLCRDNSSPLQTPSQGLPMEWPQGQAEEVMVPGAYL